MDICSYKMKVCKFYLGKIPSLIAVIILVRLSHGNDLHFAPKGTYSLSKFLSQLIESNNYPESNLCTKCTLQFFWKRNKSFKFSVNDHDVITNLLLFSNKNLSMSGVTLSSTDYNSSTTYTGQNQYHQPTIISHSRRCSIVIIFMNSLNYTDIKNNHLENVINSPILLPPTVRNRDKYLIMTPENLLTKQFHKSQFIKGLKYKLFVVPNPKVNSCQLELEKNCTDFSVSFYRSCQYGMCKGSRPYFFEMNLTGKVFDIQHIFPDHEKNFYGDILRLSTTTNVPQLLEMKVVKDENCKERYIAKRGLYATVLEELSSRLNFTYVIVPSSGKGSTGHALPNGTWVGTVGDTYRGEVDFGFMAAITYHRFPYAELCAPINFAYLGFVTGPPQKKYRWSAILWPFNPVVWFFLGLTIVVASKLVATFSRYSSLIIKLKMATVSIFNSNEKMKLMNSFTESSKNESGILSSLWGYFNDMATLVRGLFEQCETLPKSLSSSYRTFLIVWLLFCLVMSTAYRSKMVSLLTFPVYDIVPNSFDELATNLNFKIDFHYFGNVGYSYFKSSTNPAFMRIFGRMGREPDPIKCIRRTLLEKAACIIFIATFEELLHRNLSDKYGKSPLKFTPHRGALFPAGVIHQYKAPLSNNFKGILLPAMETGLIPNWQQEDYSEVLKKKNQWQNANNVDINGIIWGNEMGFSDNLLRVKHLHGAFILFGVGLVLSSISFSVERMARRGLPVFTVTYKGEKSLLRACSDECI